MFSGVGNLVRKHPQWAMVFVALFNYGAYTVTGVGFSLFIAGIAFGMLLCNPPKETT